jgi:PAS domain S-box-containing protein
MLELYIKHTEAMKRHIEMLDALFKHATEGIVVVDNAGNIFRVNPKACEMFGYSDGELVGEKIEVLIPRRHAKKHVQNRVGYSQGPHARGMGSYMDLYARRRDDSEFPVEVSLSPFATSEGDFVVSFIVDITERKKQDDAIRAANQEIQKLNAELEARVEQRTRELAEAMRKLEDSQVEVMRALEKERELNDMKSKFVTIASHEFRTPLATILSSASLIGRYPLTEDEDKRHKHVQRIKSAVTNLTEILNDFLSIGRLEEGKVHTVPVQINLPDFCHQLLEELKGVCKDKQWIQHQHQGPDEVWLDRQLLKNILLNLLSNAIKYSDAGKNIYLRTRIDDDDVYFEIQDEGIGIPDKDQPYVFDRFFRAHNAGNAQGTGLGLNIVKKYIDLLNGEITFSSIPGRGTTFKVMLPHHKQVFA